MAPIAIPRRTNQCHTMSRARTVATTAGQFRVKAVLERTSGLVLHLTGGRARIRSHALCRRRGRHAGTSEHGAHPPEDAAPGGPYRAAWHRIPATYRDLSEGGGVNICRMDKSFLTKRP